MTEEEINAKCDAIRQIAYDLHVYLGVGYLAKVYENGLAHRLALTLLHLLSFVAKKDTHPSPHSCISCPLWLKNLGIKRRSFMV